jgi:hypothetical protein
MVRPRKNKASPRTVSVSSDESHSDKLDAILEKLSALDGISSKITKMEKILAATQAENTQLKETIKNQDARINDLQHRLNNLEQHGRSVSIRVNNLPLEEGEERDPPAVISKVYNTVFLHILKGAASKQAISQVPSCFEMIEMAHPLPGKSDRPKPIIVRFFNRNLKSVLFKHRKEFAVKSEESGPIPRYKFPFHDDLTRDTYLKMKKLQGDPRVHSCWQCCHLRPNVFCQIS